MNCQYEKNLISLVTPGWNGKSFVHRLLDSIIAQTYRPIQYIYVDDGSTDGTADIVKDYERKFIDANIEFLYIRQDNAGMCHALMTGFQYVKGEYLSNPEYDDILLPESIERRVEYLKNHPDCAVVVADAWVVPETNIKERKVLISHKNPNRFDRNHFYQCLMSNTIFNAACYMVRMEQFDQTHPDRKIIPYKYGSNQQILLPLYYHWNRGFMDIPLSICVRRHKSLSKILPSLYEEVNRDVEYRSLLFSIIDDIDMSEGDKSLYKERVEINVQKDFFKFGDKYKDLALKEKAFLYLKEKGEIDDVMIKDSLIRRLYKKFLI